MIPSVIRMVHAADSQLRDQHRSPNATWILTCTSMIFQLIPHTIQCHTRVAMESATEYAIYAGDPLDRVLRDYFAQAPGYACYGELSGRQLKLRDIPRSPSRWLSLAESHMFTLMSFMDLFTTTVSDFNGAASRAAASASRRSGLFKVVGTSQNDTSVP